MNRLFISYSRADYIDEKGQIIEDSAVNMILESIKATNSIDVWIDVNAKYSGKYFTSVLAKKIMWADKVLFLSSKNSNSSEWVSKEILYAYDNKKEILPVLLDPSSFNVDFALILTGIDYIEYYKNPQSKIADIIENIIGESQEIEDSLVKDENSTRNMTQYSSHSPNLRKGCLSLNVNYKGCAMSMTILMGLLFLIGIFVPFDNAGMEDNAELADGAPVINHEDSIISKTAGSNSKPNHSIAQKEERHSNTIKENLGGEKSLSKEKTGSNHPLPLSTRNQKHIARNTIESGKEGNADTTLLPLGTETHIAQNDEKPGSEMPSVHTPSGAVAGPRYHSDTVGANSSDTYNKVFKGGELAVVSVMGDGDTDLDVYVYDSNGNLVASDVDATDDCVISWTPKWTGEFRIVIKNKGSVYNSYTLTTNQ